MSIYINYLYKREGAEKVFVFSIKSSKLKIALTAFAAVLAVAAVVLLINRGKPAVSDNAISLKASNASERAAFLFSVRLGYRGRPGRGRRSDNPRRIRQGDMKNTMRFRKRRTST